jgi:hypothetical protein
VNQQILLWCVDLHLSALLPKKQKKIQSNDAHNSTNYVITKALWLATTYSNINSHLKTDDTSKTSHLPHGKLMLGMTWQAWIVNTLYLPIILGR